MAINAAVELRSRGISAQDVWQACDALLIEGARPTIERVRQKLGRGSPNTVSTHLDAWFGKLGARIQDPMAFSAPPAIPEPVQQAAVHFWEVALAQTRHDFDERLRAGLADAVANIESEKERAAIAEAAAFDASAKLSHLQADHDRVVQAFEAQQRACAHAEAQLADARSTIEQLRERLDRALAETAEVRKSSERAIAEAIERFTAAERRAALEIDHERVARGKAEKGIAALERRLDAVQSESQAASMRHVDQVAQLNSLLEQLRDDIKQSREREDDTQATVAKLREQLAQAKAEIDTAKAQAALATRLVTRLSSVERSGPRLKHPKR